MVSATGRLGASGLGPATVQPFTSMLFLERTSQNQHSAEGSGLTTRTVHSQQVQINSTYESVRALTLIAVPIKAQMFPAYLRVGTCRP